MTDLIETRNRPVQVIRPDAKPLVGNTATVVEEVPNIKLLRDVLDYIKAFPQTWKQDEWFAVLNRETQELVPHLVEIEYTEINSCGSAMCFAGHAALIEGFPAPPKNTYENWHREVEGRDRREDVSEFASKRLGLSFDVANELFDASNTLEVLEAMIDEIEENPTVQYWRLSEIRSEILGEDEEEYYEDDEDTW